METTKNTRAEAHLKHDAKTALVSGANKGIGLETVRQLLQKGIYVFMGSRDIRQGQQALERLRAEGLKEAEVLVLDVNDTRSVEAALAYIAGKTTHLDILINNAGIHGGMPYTALEASTEQFSAVLETNLLGVVRLTQAALKLMKPSPAPRIVNVSSSVGSLSLQSTPDWPAYHQAKYAVYASSKAALNMYTIHLAYELRDSAFKVNAVCPGYTKTDFTGHQGGEVEVAGRRILKYALIDREGPSGKFFSEETNPETEEIPW
ncbi:SDR family NAD(P)-dependent oxidoreductase [Porifericola rhodea]|uniref:SDR family NAD(P)-dependent oxidoreductase n=1 Tax=Porifericola rhodea TaxID=930972 RepID=UPI00266621F6|nr:SDR family NAD(P)-dependent oxidoreductase [Porifericola rhodea]WKN30313.1 SDR family NAD(P)-dependent oxidoreductase [Porifericola rhodea]